MNTSKVVFSQNNFTVNKSLSKPIYEDIQKKINHNPYFKANKVNEITDLLEKNKHLLTEYEYRDLVKSLIKNCIDINHTKLRIRDKSNAIELLKSYKGIFDEYKDEYRDFVKELLANFMVTAANCDIPQINDLLKEYKVIFVEHIDEYRKLVESFINIHIDQPTYYKLQEVEAVLKDYKDIFVQHEYRKFVEEWIEVYIYTIKVVADKKPYQNNIIYLLNKYQCYFDNINGAKNLIIKLLKNYKVCNIWIQPVFKRYIEKINSEAFSEIIKVIEGIDLLDICFNHINNQSGSILTAINSIKDQQSRLDKMSIVINYLQDKNISLIRNALEDILYSDKIYLEDDNINNFIINKILQNRIDEAKIKVWDFELIEIKILLDYINKKEVIVKQDFMLKNSSLINQIIYFGRKLESNNDNQSTKESILELENTYFQIDKILTIKKMLDAAILYGKEYHEISFIFISEDQKQYFCLSEKYYEKWILNKHQDNNISVSGAIWYKQEDNLYINKAINDPSNLFEIFTLFKSVYTYYKNKSKFSELIYILNLKEYQADFIMALENKQYKSKLIKIEVTLTGENLISIKNKNDFADIFGEFIESEKVIGLTGEDVLNIKLKDDHVRNIINVYNINENQKAQLFLCLSAIFAKYSSSSFFGTEHDSINPLRNYALALLNKAIELDSSIVESKYLQDDQNNWKYKFSGYNNSFSCTAILSDFMIQEIKRKKIDILNLILPIVWY